MNRSTRKRATQPRRSSFRSRLIWNMIAVVFVTVAGTAVFALLRANKTIGFITDQLSQNVTDETRKDISATATQHASALDSFFAAVSDDMLALGNAIELLLEQEPILQTNSYWDSHEKLSRLSQGSWDNQNDEPGSVFIPVGGEISESLYAELNTLKQMDFFAPGLLKKNPDLVAVYFGSEQGETLYYPNIDLANILPPDFDITQRPWYLAAAPEQDPERGVVWSVPYQDAALHGLVVTSSMPIYDSTGHFRGVLAMDIKLTSISTLVNTIRVGNSGYAFLLDGQGRVIAMTDAGLADFGLTRADIEGDTLPSILAKVPLDAFELLVKMTSHQSGVRSTTLNGEEKYVAYRPLPSVGYSLGVAVPVSETRTGLNSVIQMSSGQSRTTFIQIGGATLVALLLVLLISQWMANSLAAPLSALTKTAEQLAGGDLSAESDVQSQDEFGTLAQTFNSMAARLRNTIGLLEQRVAERTAELEATTQQSERRAHDLQTVSEVARSISSEVDIEKLLSLITPVVSERFGFYHVGVFLLDQLGEYAVLRASNSPGGKRMLEKGHKLQVGEVGIVGYVAAVGEPRIALDVGEDATFFNNPDLPETRSEMALPLNLRGDTIGVLDVQSVQPNAFTQADVETLSILADQVAIAIDNARLFTESQQALAEVQTLYGEYIGRAWEHPIKNFVGYLQSPAGGHLLATPLEWDEAQAALATGRVQVASPEVEEQNTALAVPIRLQNRVIGVIDVRASDPNRRWKQDEIAVIEAAAERLGLAMENARLFEEASTRALRERAVSEITSKIRRTNDPQTILRTAIEELRNALGASRVEIVPHVVPTHPPEDEAGGADGKERRP